MPEQLDAQQRITGAVESFFTRFPDGGRTGNSLGPIRHGDATVRLGRSLTRISATVFSDMGPDMLVTLTDTEIACPTEYFNCSGGRWSMAGKDILPERAAALCLALTSVRS